MSSSTLSKEKKLSKVGAVFWTLRDARRVVEKIQHDPETQEMEVTVLHPTDNVIDRKLQPETEGVKRTLFATHRNFAVVGLCVGLGLYILALSLGAQEITSTPLMSALAMMSVGTLSGLIIAGLVSLRPDHDRLMRLSDKARRTGRWMVIAHASSKAQTIKARELMRTRAIETTATL